MEDRDQDQDWGGIVRAVATVVGEAVRVADVLNDGDRTAVLRIAPAASSSPTWVAKLYREPAAGTWAREAAGLRTAGGTGAPALVGVVPPGPEGAEPVVVMADLGDGVCLADHLLGTDAHAGGQGLLAWARGVASLHAAAAARREVFADLLAKHAAMSAAAVGEGPEPLPHHEEMVRSVRDLQRQVADAGLPGHPGLDVEVEAALDPLFEESAWTLSPGDTCPDNNRLADGRLALLDFEFAEFRHPAWDLAYLRVPWPTCWCSWRIPEAVLEPAVEAYLSTAAHLGLPWVDGLTSGDLAKALDAATLAFCFGSSAWFLPRALADSLAPDAQGDDGDERRPGRRAMILGRLDRAAELTRYPGPASYAVELGEALRRRWGDVELSLAPAFR